MGNFSNLSLAAMYIIAISVCGGIPHPQHIGTAPNRNVDEADGFLGVLQWLWSAFSSMRPSVHEEMNSYNTVIKLLSDKTHKQSSSVKATDEDHDMSILIHKDNDLSGIKLSSSLQFGNEKVNPFIRAKRSTCNIPAYLQTLVSDLNSLLNASQHVVLDPKQPYEYTIPANQPDKCTNDTINELMERSESNLRSTCPWTIAVLDLGEHAFPRHIKTAVCLCLTCIGSKAFRCDEITQTVTYFYRQGCWDGLAQMNSRNVTITVACHCVRANPQTETINPGPTSI